MSTVAVIAHTGKTIGGGLTELRSALALEGVTDPLWSEIPKSRKAPKRAKLALEEGADLVMVWGGDGTVQRCVDALAGSDVPIAIIPAGTANLFASNLGIPKDIAKAVRIGLHGERRPIDVGRINGERFAVMAGAGLDAAMIRDADAGLKDQVGRLAYLVTGARHLKDRSLEVRIQVDGTHWYQGKAACVLFGNVPDILGGVTAFADARPDDGRLEIGIVTADGLLEWTRTLGRTAVGQVERSPFVDITAGTRFVVKLDRKATWELDGGDREPAKRLEVEVEPGAITVCVDPRAQG
ncbi:MAG: diacylglycerol/lipid kinase family protein [Myxococcota bacterium]